MLRVRCFHCREWDEEKEGYRYHFVNLTDWKPPFGIEPRIRKFHCSYCGTDTFRVLTAGQLSKLGEEGFV